MKKSLLPSLGVVIYVIISTIDKFIYKIPNYLYIILAITGITLIVIGYIKDKKNNV